MNIKKNKFIPLLQQLIKEVASFNSPIDKLLSRLFYQNKLLNSKERHLIAETVYTMVRNYYKVSSNVNIKDTLSVIGFIWLNFLNIDNTTFKYYEIDHSQIKKLEINNDIQTKSELPQWIIDQLRLTYSDEEIIQLGAAMQNQAPLDLRVNTLKSSVKEIMETLSQDGLNPIKTSISPYGIRLFNKTFLSNHPIFTSGKIEVQDESSQIAGQLLNPKRGEMVVDFCAGSGGKTLLFGMLMRNSGRIYAFDNNEKRLNNLTPRLARSGLSNVHPQLINNENDTKIKRLQGKIDRVFVDAPCSGLGTIRRNPELKFRQTPDSIKELNQKQLSILTAASKLLKNHGFLVYATCSILKAENQDIINTFLENNPNFKIINAHEIIKNDQIKRDDGLLVLLPHLHTSDGFFAALLQKVD